MQPEEKARLIIDQKLIESGYVIQDIRDMNLLAAKGVIVREYPTDTGEVDYLIFINAQPVGIIEAKEINKGEKLVVETEKQTERYKNSKLKYFPENVHIRFAYESTGEITRFTDYNDINYRSREVFSFHKPEELERLMKESDTLRNRLKSFPKLNEQGFRRCQITAINNLEKSFGENRPRALIQMATGAGKTYTAITAIYRLLKFCSAKRILFLVDTKNLGKQAMDEFTAYKPSDDNRTFVELYPVQLLKSSYISESTNVCISTIQRMYSILRGEELDESLEESPIFDAGLPKEVVYNAKYPIEFFDFIIIDECHRSIYNVWKQVLDYFDAFQIGLTATPDKRTFGYFNENIVSEYTREQAIIDGVNVGEDEYIIETEIGSHGSKITKAKRVIQKRERLTRKQRWESMDEDIVYTSNQLDRDVVNPSQIRNVIKAFKQAIQEVVYPERKEVPKTLIFAKTDSHADDIIQIVRDEFGEGNEFCRKITYRIEGNPNDEINAFRNDYKFRIAVTVDMIATGTDIKPLECLLFMRDVRSKNYYEQMKGRGTRTIDLEELRKVSPSAKTNKDHFVIFDAVGVTKSVKSEGRTLERQPSESLKDLLMRLAVGNADEDVITSVAGRLTRLDKIMTAQEHKDFSNLSGGVTIGKVVSNMLNCFDKDYLEEKTMEVTGSSTVSKEDIKNVQNKEIALSIKPFSNAKLRDFILSTKASHEQIIDTYNIDTVIRSGWSESYTEDALKTIKSFREFIEANKDEIEALSIIYNQQYRNRKLTYKMIKELHDIMCKPPYNFTVTKMWHCYYERDNDKVVKSEVDELMDIISIIRYELGQIDRLNSFDSRVRKNFQDWTFKRNNSQGYRFNEEQMEWLHMIEEHIIRSASIEEEDFDYTPFDTKGGLVKYYKVFGKDYLNIINELNVALAA